jgi:hypothetical protein
MPTKPDLHDAPKVPTLPSTARGLPQRSAAPDLLLTEKRRGIVADIRANGRRQRWPEWRVVEGIRIGLRLPTTLAALRLWRWWTPEEAVANIRATASEGDVERLFTTGDLAEWEAGRRRVPVDLLDAVCKVYRTRPDRIGYPDYSTPLSDPV